MSTLIKSQDVRTIAGGINVSRAAANLPQTAAGNLFAVSGGRILLVALVGEVTTIIQAQATTVKLTSTPTTGSAIDLSAATTDINALEVGGRLTLANPPAAGTARSRRARARRRSCTGRRSGSTQSPSTRSAGSPSPPSR